MSAAIRGDFERLRDRGVASTLASPETEPAPEVATEEVPQPSMADEEPAKRNWRDRFFG